MRSATIPSTGKRGAGPVGFWVGRETDDVSKYGVSWEEPDFGERVAAKNEGRQCFRQTPLDETKADFQQVLNSPVV